MLVKSVLAILALLFSGGAFAQSYKLGAPVVAGPGCPSGSASASVTDDGSAISILFDQFSIQKRAGDLPGALRCTIHIPVETQPGYVVAASSVDYRGFYNLPAGVQGRVFTYGAIHGRKQKQFQAQTVLEAGTTDFDISQTVRQITPGERRECDSKDIIGFTTELAIGQFRGQGQRPIIADAQLTLDSIDSGATEIKLGVRIVKCVGRHGRELRGEFPGHGRKLKLRDL